MNYVLLFLSSNRIVDEISSNASKLPLIICMLIVIAFYIAGSARGFIAQLVSVFSIILSIVAAKLYGGVLSVYLSKYFLGTLLNSINVIKNVITGLLNKYNIGGSFANGLIGNGVDSIASILSGLFSNAIGYIVVFVVAMFVMNLVSKLLVGINVMPVLGGLNKLLGGLLGIVKAILLVEIVFFIMEQVSFIPAVNIAISYIKADRILSELWQHSFVSMLVVLK